MISDRLRRAIKRVVGISLVTLVLLEIALRFILGGAEHGGIYQFHTTGLADGRCVGLRPNAQVDFTGFVGRIPAVRLEVNALGYRGAARPREKTPGVFRVAALGDSYTYGIGKNDESIPAQLERVLGDSVEVLNFGIPGAQLVDLVSHARILVSQWHPDLIVFFLFWNDLDEPLCAWTSPPYSWIASLARGLYVFRIPLIVMVVADDPDKRRAQREATLRLALRDLSAGAREMGARLAIVVLGDPVSRESGRISPDPSPVLRTTLTEFQIPWLDARSWMSTDTAQHPLPRIPFDGHFTAEGNRLAAERTAQWLSHHIAAR